MARRPRRGFNIPAFPVPTEPRFRPAYFMLVIGLGLLLYQNLNKEVSSVKDLSAAEGTLLNYSFKKTAEGKKDYGFWLLEHPERFVLSEKTAVTFDTAAFKAQAPLGQRLKVEYNTNANPRETEGNQLIYSLSIPKQEKVILEANTIIKQEQKSWMTWLAYICLAGSLAWFVWQLYEQNLQKSQERY